MLRFKDPTIDPTPMHDPIVCGELPIWAEHDVACPVCHTNKAILTTWDMVFQPCYECARVGWQTVQKAKRWWRR